MLIIPAIDIRNSKCVMLTKGDPDRESVYSEEPSALAQVFQEAGVKRLHIVDLDAAFGGPANIEVIKKIRASVKIPIQIGGGVRDFAKINDLINEGFDYVIAGTLAVISPDALESAAEKFPGRIIVACDVVNGKVAVNGWRKLTEISAEDFIMTVGKIGIGEVIVTDVSRDGMLSGLNLELIRNLASRGRTGIIASGGVRDINDISVIKNLGHKNIKGVIIGKAIYEGNIDLKSAIALFE